jgi:hypothetical protein
VHPASRYSSVRLDVASRATVGDKVEYTVIGSIGSTKPNWPNFAVGLAYHDGPVESLRITAWGREYRLRRGWALVATEKRVDPGTTVVLSGRIIFESVGSYVLVGVAGYVDEIRGGVVIDSSDLKTVEVAEPGIRLGDLAIPWWALAAAGACVAVAVATGVVLHTEHEKEMAMLMALASR